MGETRTYVFESGDDQAVLIPSEVQADGTEYFICKTGEAYLIYPADDPWLPTRLAIALFSDDYMADREQPTWDDVAKREDW